MTKRKVFVGIDPGNEGAIVAIDTEKGLVYCTVMPTVDVGDSKKKNIIVDALSFKQIVEDLMSEHNATFAIEVQQAFPEQGIASTAKTMRAFGIMEGILIGVGASYRLVRPKQWQAVRHGVTGVGKELSCRFVESEVPALSLRPGRKRTDHDGLADAACMALFIRRWDAFADAEQEPKPQIPRPWRHK
jgi:Holliday junction resolvasome RuvABC endonuclease subunit